MNNAVRGTEKEAKTHFVFQTDSNWITMKTRFYKLYC